MCTKPEPCSRQRRVLSTTSVHFVPVETSFATCSDWLTPHTFLHMHLCPLMLYNQLIKHYSPVCWHQALFGVSNVIVVCLMLMYDNLFKLHILISCKLQRTWDSHLSALVWRVCTDLVRLGYTIIYFSTDYFTGGNRGTLLLKFAILLYIICCGIRPLLKKRNIVLCIHRAVPAIDNCSKMTTFSVTRYSMGYGLCQNNVELGEIFSWS